MEEIVEQFNLSAEFAEALNWNREKQQALLGHLLTVPEFFCKTKGKIEPNWFMDDKASKAYKAQLDFDKRLNRMPTCRELRELDTFKLEESIWYNSFKAYMQKCLDLRPQFPLDQLRGELTAWLQSRLFHQGMSEVTKLFNAKRPDEAYGRFRLCSKAINESVFEEDLEVKFDDIDVLFARTQLELKNALTFGIDSLDKLLTPGAEKGSLLIGDTTVLLAPTNVGKTTAMITIAAANINQGKNVMFVIHEGRPDDIRIKILCCMLGIDSGRLMTMNDPDYPENRERIQLAQKKLKDHFVFVPMLRPGLPVEEVIRVIASKMDDFRVVHGEPIHMVIDDYPAKLSSKAGEGDKIVKMHKRELDDYVYNHFVNAALFYKFHAVVAIQSNREGSKANKRHGSHKEDDKLLEMEDVQESWGPMTTATNVITMNRTPKAEFNNVVIFRICKSRSSVTGWAVVCASNYACATTHSNNLGSTWYRDNSSMDAKIDSILEKYKGQEIDFTVLRDLKKEE